MKKLAQRFHNMKLSLKLLVSYVLIVAVAITGMAAIVYRSAHDQLKNAVEQMLTQAAQSAGDTLRERCIRVERSMSYLATDTYVQRIINETNYLSEYQKAYDVNNYLEPTIISVMEQNPLISEIDFYTYGEVKNTRIFLRDWKEIDDDSLLQCGEQPVWNWDGEKITVARVVANIWQPNRSAVMLVILDSKAFLENLLPEMEPDCTLLLQDAEGNCIFTQSDIADPAQWEKTEHTLHECMLLDNNWRLMVQGDASVQTQAVPSDVLVSMALILAGVCIVMLLIAWRFSVGISSRLDQLHRQVSRAATEEYQNDITSSDRDEIGEITNAVGDIVRETRQLMQQTYQSELDRREAQIQALQAQINPHFLYNTLSNLNWRLIAKGDEEGSRLVTELSKFYRLSLNGGQIRSTLEDELQHVGIYIRLYCATHEGSEPEVLWQIGEGLGACKIPGMILQPLVENAFAHGRPSVGKPVVKLSVCEKNENIILRVEDNGPGLNWEGKACLPAAEFFQQYSGYGLRNVYRRLQLLFSDSCTMSFCPSLLGGTAVVLCIPLECGQ